MQLSRALLLAVGLFEAVLECQALSVGLEAVLGAGDYDKIPGHSCPGGNMGILNGANFVNTCKTECDDEANCIGFVRIESANRCFLKAADNCDMTEHFQANSNKDAYFKVGVLNGTVNAGLAGLPTLAPTAAPTTAPTLAPTAAAGSASATGDPHLVNTLGERFDILQPGVHALLAIPRSSEPKRSLLYVEATVVRVGGNCADMYFQTLNMTGQWVAAHSQQGVVHYSAHKVDDQPWRQYGQVDIKVTWGHTSEGVKYINFLVRNLKRTNYSIGGLLGEDDHSLAATPSAACMHKMAI